MPDPQPSTPAPPARRPRRSGRGGDKASHKDAERRQFTVAYLHATGHGPSEIARVLDVPVRTIGKDLKDIRDRRLEPRTAAEMGAQVDGVVNWLTTPLSQLLRSEDAFVQIHAARALWAIFKDKVGLEQAIGLAPKEAEKVEVVTEVGARLRDVLLAVSQRMTPEAAAELARAVKAVHAEVPDVAELLVP